MKLNVPKLALSIAFCFLFAFAGGTFTPEPGSEWYYQLLNKPSWNPPDWLFPPAWTLFFLLMGIALYLVVTEWDKNKLVKGALAVFGVQLLLNLAWSALFFGLHSPLFALVDIVLLWLAIVLTIVKFRAISPLAGNLLIPYLLWVSFASFLNFTIWQLN
ncbi:TspO/MBR family protein [Chlorobium ferrooxidans]|uniref:TspO/MBR-related protein n=1 Tax=Chlorobium ferrooxidans DSM 13031 TaxID=377431 RepID=Q0YU19_9CHLB|nr:TspO/MBR family protein [Chlorobium ferrooxidans]EAT59735.1 TspO/MBR-related protein [Chlorobium ferrooxidans DSM 13031]